MYLLVQVFEFAARVTQEELALYPNREAEDVGKEQDGVGHDTR